MTFYVWLWSLLNRGLTWWPYQLYDRVTSCTTCLIHCFFPHFYLLKIKSNPVIVDKTRSNPESVGLFDPLSQTTSSDFINLKWCWCCCCAAPPPPPLTPTLLDCCQNTLFLCKLLFFSFHRRAWTSLCWSYVVIIYETKSRTVFVPHGLENLKTLRVEMWTRKIEGTVCLYVKMGSVDHKTLDTCQTCT